MFKSAARNPSGCSCGGVFEYNTMHILKDAEVSDSIDLSHDDGKFAWSPADPARHCGLFPSPVWMLKETPLSVDSAAITKARARNEDSLMDRRGDQKITMHDLAELNNPVGYYGLKNWQRRAPKKSGSGGKQVPRLISQIAANSQEAV